MQSTLSKDIPLISKSSPPKYQSRVRWCIAYWKHHGTHMSLLDLRDYLQQMRCILRYSLRSFVGHIQIRLAKDLVCFGPALRPDEMTPEAQRTVWRSLYTEMLQATYPWIDMTDIRIFLMGFEAGEQFSSHKDNALHIPVEMSDSSWLSHFHIDMLKRQWYKSQYESARPTDTSESH